MRLFTSGIIILPVKYYAVLFYRMETRHFPNKYNDYSGEPVEIDKKFYRTLITSYVRQIIDNTSGDDSRGDLYVGDSGETIFFFRCFCSNDLVISNLL